MTMKKILVNKVESNNYNTNTNVNTTNDNTTTSSDKKHKLQHSKVVRQSFAVGGLDQEYIDWGMGASGM